MSFGLVGLYLPRESFTTSSNWLCLAGDSPSRISRAPKGQKHQNPENTSTSLVFALLLLVPRFHRGNLEVGALWWVSSTAGGPALREHACCIIGNKETRPVCAPGLALCLSYWTIAKPPSPLQGHTSTSSEAVH